MDNNFSKTLKFLKNKKGVTDEKIAEYLGVSRQAVIKLSLPILQVKHYLAVILLSSLLTFSAYRVTSC